MKINRRKFTSGILSLLGGIFVSPKVVLAALKPVEKVPDVMVGNFESNGGVFDNQKMINILNQNPERKLLDEGKWVPVDISFKTRRSSMPSGNWRKLNVQTKSYSSATMKINGRSL